MNSFAILLSQGTSSAWLFIPSAILLGALHGLEPGHSKTMMAAFIIAIRGTVKQAVMLGLAATLSHTAVVWLIALGGMYISNKFTADSAEPWFQLISGIIILATAVWMVWRTWSEAHARKRDRENHNHGDVKIVNTGHGRIELAIAEEGALPRWQLRTLSGHDWAPADITLVTVRDNGSSQEFRFIQQNDMIVSSDVIPEPHAFIATLTLGHGNHTHSFDTEFHEHEHTGLEGLEAGSVEYQDAHQRAHANDISRRFDGKKVTNLQILFFGLTGGLIPCPAAITILLLCIQLKQFSLGAALVVCFSIGLALTLVAVGAGAALSVKHVSKRWSGLSRLAGRAPYLSGALIAVVGIYMALQGLTTIAA